MIPRRRTTIRHYVLALLVAAVTGFAFQTLAPRTVSSHWTGLPYQDSSVMDGDAGPCSVDLTVTDADGKPVFAALISVHIEYGFHGFHKLDLSVYSNNDGKAKFIGLPDKIRKPPLEFRAKKDKAAGLAVYNPATECQGRHDIVLRVPGS